MASDPTSQPPTYPGQPTAIPAQPTADSGRQPTVEEQWAAYYAAQHAQPVQQQPVYDQQWVAYQQQLQWAAYQQQQQQQQRGNLLSIIGIVLGGLSILFLPIVLGPAGLILGGIAMSKGEPLAKWALWISGLGMIAGFILGVMVYTAMTP